MRAYKVVRNLTIVAAVCAIVFLIVYLVYESKLEKATDYTVAQHTARVTELAKKRYLKEGSEYTDLQVFPLYNAENKLVCFLIEFQPRGFVYVKVRSKAFEYDYVGLYVRDFHEGDVWVRMTVEMGTTSTYINNNGGKVTCPNTRLTELDKDGNPILHYDSHFKAYNIQNEQYYFLEYKYSYIPAVKRDNKFFNLISLEYMDFNNSDNEKCVTASCNFLFNSNFSL